MREILFRGKCLHDNEWFEGESILQNNDFTLIAKAVTLGINEKGIANLIRDSIFNAVIPETVGQYTGLTDKNGTKIFEGDIVLVYYSDGLIEKGCIGWSDISIRYTFASPDGSGYGIDVTDTFEVIGNIYDNPELLGGATND